MCWAWWLLFWLLLEVSCHLSTYLLTYLPTYLSTNLPTYLPTCLPAYLPTYQLTYIHTYLPTTYYLHTYLPYLLNYYPTYLPTNLPTYILTYLPTYLPTTNVLSEWVTDWLPSCLTDWRSPVWDKNWFTSTKKRKICPFLGLVSAAKVIHITSSKPQLVINALLLKCQIQVTFRIFVSFFVSGEGYKGRRNANCSVQGKNSSMADRLVFW